MSAKANGNFTLVQLTDTHLLPVPGLLYGQLDTWERLQSALGAAAHFRPDVVVLTGDLADGKSDIYEAASALLEEAAEELECPLIVLPGNHDLPERTAGFNRHRAFSGPGQGDTVHLVRGLRVIGLDSNASGSPSGVLSAAQLEWLALELSAPAPHGTVLAIHHPPIESMLPQLAGRGLANPEQLQAVLSGTDVRAILCGHYHHGLSGRLGAVPVWVSPAVSYNQNLFAPAATVQGLDTTWISVITLAPASFSATPVPVGADTAVFTSAIRRPPSEPAGPQLSTVPSITSSTTNTGTPAIRLHV